MRTQNTDSSGRGFSDSVVQAVWDKGRAIDGYDPNAWRRDAYGTPMKRPDYGRTDKKNGWEVDHVYPVAAGGGDELTNMQPLQWENNRKKGDQIV
jgi:5-methylcytosine-specific restriction endonuclease McrA